jgi:hypothetical protein
MKIKNPLLLICLLFLGLILSKKSMGQSPLNFPTTCSIVATGNQNFYNVSLPDTNNWFKWKTDSTVVSINLKMLSANGKYAIAKAKLYKSINGHLENLIQQEISTIDSTIFIYAQHLNINDSLYLNITTNIQCTGCSTTPPTVNFSFLLMPQGCNGYTQPTCELVKDGGMEFFNLNCSQLRTGFPWAPCFWYLPNAAITPGTSDYFNACAPITVSGVTGLGVTANTTINAFSQGIAGLNTHSGTGYLGAFNYINGIASGPSPNGDYREYITNVLNSPLVTGKKYIVSMYVRLSNVSRYAISNIQVLFTNNIPIQPQATSTSGVPYGTVISPTGGQFINSFTVSPITNKAGWSLLTTTITANSNYTHLTIGNFRTNAFTQITDLGLSNPTWNTVTPGQAAQWPSANTVADCAYYYYDDVSVRAIDLVVSPDKSICTPSVVALSSTLSCIPSGASVSYAWSPTNGLSSINTASTNASPTVTTNYILTATITFTNSDGTVSVITLTDDVNVSVTNSGTFTLSANAIQNPICLIPGATTTLTTNTGANLSYTWTNGVNTYTVPSPIVSPTVTTTYTVSTINCGQTMSALVTVTVNPPPTFSFTPNAICENTQVSITTATNTTITYIDFGDPNSFSNVINPHVYNANGNYSITINATTLGSCNSHTIIPITVVTLTSSSISYTPQACSYTYTIAQTFNCTNISDDTYFEIYSSSNSTLSIYPTPTTPVTGGVAVFTFPGPGTYTVNGVSLPTGYSATTVINVPLFILPTIAITASPSKTICAGNSVTLTASGANTYTWSTSETTNSIVVTPSTTTAYTAIGTNTAGCIDTETITITVIPNVTLTASASPTVICAGKTTTLTANGATTYTWNPGALAGATVAVTPTATTIYTVIGSNGSCTNTKTVSVTVNALPSLTIAATATNICIGSSVTLTSSGASSYTWSPGALTNTVITVAPTVTTTYTLTGVNALGCTNTKTITINVTTIPTITATASPSIICKGNSSTLTATGATTYTWSNGATTSTTAVTPTITTTYTVTGANGTCSNTKTITVTVVASPTITATASPTIICAGKSSTLTASGATTYTWNPGALTGATVNVTPSTTTTYTLLGSNGACVVTKTVVVTVNPKPTPLVASSSFTACAGSTMSITSSTTGINSYTWAPCVTACNSNTINVNINQGPNNFTLSVTGTNGCTNTAVKTITGYANPTVTATSATICTGSTATLTAGGATTYTWNTGATTNTLAVSPTVTTSYTVTGKNAQCAALATSTVFVSTGVIPSYSINAPANNAICANGTGTNTPTFSTSITNTTGLSFAWSPGGATSATPTIAITQPITVGVTVSDLACGTSSVQDVCINYVASTCCNPTLTTLTNTVITNVNQIPNTMYKVVGTLTFSLSSTSFALGSKEFLMSTGSKIMITPTTSIQINACKFYSCGGMWEGIELQNTPTSAASIFIDDVTTIEDAYKALSANTLSVNVNNYISIGQNTTFNKNYIDVYLQDWISVGNTYAFETIKSNYTSSSSTTSPGGNLKCSQYYTPTIKARSAVGIYAINATSVNVASTGGSTVNANYFNNKDYGIVLEKTSGLVTNAKFENMAGINGSCQTVSCTPTLPTGVGIYATTSNAIPTFVNITSTPAAVTFSNVQCAIFGKKLTDLSILNVNIENPNQSNWGSPTVAYGYGYNGIYTEDIKRELHINYNTIKNAFYGVQSTFVNAANVSLLSISNNTILTTASTFTTYTGINVSSAISFAGAASNKPIAVNTLTGVRNGIQLIGLTGGMRISNNNIDMVTGNTGNAGGTAIALNGGNANCIVDNNTIRGNSTLPETTFNLSKVGIHVKTSTNCLVQCNSINAVGTGVRYEGVCNTSNDGFFSNILNGPIRRGLELKTSASMGTQGTYTGTPPTHTVLTTSKNQWAGTWTAANSDQTYVYDAGSNASASRLCVGTSSSELPSDNQWFTAFASGLDAFSIPNNSLLTSSTASAITQCPGGLSQGLRIAGVNDSLETIERDKEFKLIITENLNDPMLDTETKWQLKNYMYSAIENGTAPQDVTVQGFYNQEKTGSIDDYANVDSLIEAGDYAQAMVVNNSANVNVVTEQTTKDYNALWLSKFSNPDYVATTSDIVTITDIANQCIHKGGNAVAYARALLAAIYNHPFDYEDDCTDYKANLRIAQNTKNFESNGNDIHLYPNPNNGIFTLNYQLKNVANAEVIVEDVTGKLIYQKKLNTEITDTVLQLTDAKNGIYFVKVMNGKEILSVNKVVINN